MNEWELIRAARKALKNARADYSGFRVGAALLSSDGRLFTGCNIESSSFGLTVCAERVALVKALSEGAHDFVRMAVAAEDEQIALPCGACRQLLWDYAPNIEIICAASGDSIIRHKLSELLPAPFGKSNLTKEAE
ncbi:MAG: cytidine deaminase [candidate division Zixibacteria bacterium]|nr:cytidine deaminase [Candidatus Tariuqbacter arcticus]